MAEIHSESRKFGSSESINNKTDTVPPTPICASCHQLGHKTKRHNKCPLNPVNLANNTQLQTASTADGTMEIDTDDSPNSSPEGPFLNEYVQSEQIPEEPLDTQTLGHDSCDNSQTTPTISSSSQTHFQPDLTQLHIATINCRGLPKTADTSIRTHFIRYLRTHNLDILALQETHASSVSLQQVFHTQFQAHDSLWSRHCGLVCFSPDLSFSNSVFSICGRFITTTISHIQKAFDPLRVTVIYAPAAYSERQAFLSNLIGHPSSV
ncbi:hypothetical protein G6F37_013469 [Rhizopus arrhizus]|nr:hypothetical protein G6F37_013469 [Rhizopus arrhizus]